MMFLCNSRMVSGATREQVVEQLIKSVDEEAWELIKKGVIAQWVFKVGEQPGVVVLVKANSKEEVRRMIDTAPHVKAGLLEFEIDPVEHYPYFKRWLYKLSEERIEIRYQL